MSYAKIAHMVFLGLIAQATPFANVTDYHDWHQLLAAEISALTALAALFTVPTVAKAGPNG